LGVHRGYFQIWSRTKVLSKCAIGSFWKKIKSSILTIELRKRVVSMKFIIPYLLFVALYLVFNYGAHLGEEELD